MYPETRLRRLRREILRPIFTETTITPENFCQPLFFDETIQVKKPISSMPGQYRYPIADAADIAKKLYSDGVRSVLLFGIPKEKDSVASGAFAENGVIQSVLHIMKKSEPRLVLIADLCACEYTDHGHCGILHETCDGVDLDNDASLELMAKIAVSQARSGADIIAPSCMLDGQVQRIRRALDLEGFSEIPIMSYSTKFASSLYGPFREAADSGFKFGSRQTYQMNPANGREALRESELDLEEGADVLMVKPATFYLDVISKVKMLGIPVAAYHVSGEYAMIKAACQNGWLDEKKVVMEAMISIKRAGADLIITYYTCDIIRWISE